MPSSNAGTGDPPAARHLEFRCICQAAKGSRPRLGLAHLGNDMLKVNSHNQFKTEVHLCRYLVTG